MWTEVVLAKSMYYLDISCHDSRNPVLGSNQSPPEYKSRVLSLDQSVRFDL
jgi:hypothetical protein